MNTFQFKDNKFAICFRQIRITVSFFKLSPTASICDRPDEGRLFVYAMFCDLLIQFLHSYFLDCNHGKLIT